MSDQFLGEIRMMAFGFAPRTWALCNGQTLPISQNAALFSLFSNFYGGDGRQTFALPNCQGRTPIHAGNGYSNGNNGGEQSHTLQLAEIPLHTHPLAASNNATSTNDLTSNLLANTGGNAFYGPAQTPVSTRDLTVSLVGNSQPHSNMQPYLTVNFCVALQGVFPSRN